MIISCCLMDVHRSIYIISSVNNHPSAGVIHKSFIYIRHIHYAMSFLVLKRKNTAIWSQEHSKSWFFKMWIFKKTFASVVVILQTDLSLCTCTPYSLSLLILFNLHTQRCIIYERHLVRVQNSITLKFVVCVKTIVTDCAGGKRIYIYIYVCTHRAKGLSLHPLLPQPEANFLSLPPIITNICSYPEYHCLF